MLELIIVILEFGWSPLVTVLNIIHTLTNFSFVNMGTEEFLDCDITVHLTTVIGGSPYTDSDRILGNGPFGDSVNRFMTVRFTHIIE